MERRDFKEARVQISALVFTILVMPPVIGAIVNTFYAFKVLIGLSLQKLFYLGHGGSGTYMNMKHEPTFDGKRY